MKYELDAGCDLASGSTIYYLNNLVATNIIS